MEDYNNWNRSTISEPPKNQRILVSDGEVIVIANCINDGEHDMWFFDNPNMKDMQIVWWKDLEETPPKIENHLDNTENI